MSSSSCCSSRSRRGGGVSLSPSLGGGVGCEEPMSVAVVSTRIRLMALRPLAGPALCGSRNHHDGHESRVGGGVRGGALLCFDGWIRPLVLWISGQWRTLQRHSTAFQTSA